MAWTFGNPAFDAAYDRWRTACPPEYVEEGGVTDESTTGDKDLQ